MFNLNDKTRMLDKEYVHSIIREQQNQKMKFKKYTVKFPCHPISVEITKPEDTYLECPTCHKHYLLTYSANRTKLWAE